MFFSLILIKDGGVTTAMRCGSEASVTAIRYGHQMTAIDCGHRKKVIA